MRGALVAATAALLVSGCIDLAPPYHRPTSPVPAAFPAGQAYAPAAEAAVVGWRAFFSDPKLKTVIERALANNRDLRIAVANIAIARAQYHVQRAALFPTVGANLSATYGQTPTSVVQGAVTAPGQSSAVNERLYSATVGVSAWQLDLFGKVRDLSRAAQEQYFASRQARDAAQITLVSEVAADYLTLGADRSLLAIARATQASGQDSLDLTTKRLNAGVASGLDVSQAQTIVEQARFDVARLTTQVAQDRNALELVVGAPVADDLLPAGADVDIVVLARLPGALSSQVLLSRPDVLQAEDILRGANADIGAARAAYFPSISLTGSGGFTSLALSSLFTGPAATWSFIPQISQTIFDGGARRGNLDLARAQRDLDVAQYEKSVQTAFRETADALAQRGTVEEQLAAQVALVAANRQALALAEARYERGADTYLNVLIAQRATYAAEQTLVAAKLARQTSMVTLYGALGGGLDTPGAG
ncbi:MAG TPA: efflux transporter outer membrane subunit [Caulobacteraceae bacterium]|nr:efflux transporter outer membrane subunit [Caulobacteraceae bacterium]